MKTFRDFLNENTSALYAYFDTLSKSLRIVRPNGTKFNVNSTLFRGIRIFGVSTTGHQILVFVGNNANPQPIKILKFSDAGIYQGTDIITA